MEAIVSDSLGQPRFTSLLVTFFATVAVLLGALGIHGALAYAVAQRTRELGIRLALGAHPGDVLRLVLRQGMRPALLGIGLGLAGALAAMRLIRELLYGVSPGDPVALAAATGVMAGTALLACYMPARRRGSIPRRPCARNDLRLRRPRPPRDAPPQNRCRRAR
jgi:putative ABC transport system permease protein